VTPEEARAIYDTFVTVSQIPNVTVKDARAAAMRIHHRKETTVKTVVRLRGVWTPKERPGRPRMLTDEHVEFLLDLLSDDPTLTLKQLRERLIGRADAPVRCDETTIGRYLDGQLLSRKQIRCDPFARNCDSTKEKRYQHMLWLIENSDEYEFVFMDETPFSMYHARTTGYSRDGPPVTYGVGVRDTNRTVVMAVSRRLGVVGFDIIDGSYTTTTFMEFITNVAATLATKPTQRPWCIYLDNHRIHKPERMDEVLEPAWVQYVFNAPYSCEYNPIELVFGKYKAEIRSLLSGRYRSRIQQSYEAEWGTRISTRNVILDKVARRALGVVTPLLVSKCWGHVKRQIIKAINKEDM